KITESPIFLAALAKEKNEPVKEQIKLPIIEVLRRPKALILTMLAGASGFALQVLLSTFAVSYATEFGAERSSVLYAFAFASVASVFFVIYFAHISDRFGRRPVMLIGLALFVVFLQPFFAMMRSDNWALILLAFTVALALHAVIFGPLVAFISELFGSGSSSTDASMGYTPYILLL